MRKSSNLFQVWAGRYDPLKFKPTEWNSNPKLMRAWMQLSGPLEIDSAKSLALAFNEGEIKSLESADARPPRLWAFIFEAGQEIVVGKLYRIVASEQPSVRLRPSAN